MRRRTWALGAAAVALVACRGVLGIHELTYDGGLDADRRDAGSVDAPLETGTTEAGEDVGTGHDAGHDSGRDSGHDSGHTGHDGGHDAGHDTGPHFDAACVSACTMGAGMQFVQAFSMTVCSCAACTACTGGMRCTPPMPPDGGMPGPACQNCLANLVAEGDCPGITSTCGTGCSGVLTCIKSCGGQ